MADEKSKFEELSTITLPDAGLRFNAQRVGPMDFNELRKEADYGEGFWMPTMPELVPLTHASLENKNRYDTAKEVVKTQENHSITGNTGILYVPKGMFVEDNPNLKNGKISMNGKTLQNKLSSYEERGVIFSDDRSVRFTPYNFKIESQTPLELSINTGIIALFGGEKEAEEIAKASEHYWRKPRFSSVLGINSPIIRVAYLSSYTVFGKRMDIIAKSLETFDNKYSYGVQEIKPRAKK